MIYKNTARKKQIINLVNHTVRDGNKRAARQLNNCIRGILQLHTAHNSPFSNPSGIASTSSVAVA